MLRLWSFSFASWIGVDTISNSTQDGVVVDGVNLDEMREFAKQFKIRRLSLGLTQTQVGQALNVTEGPSYSQSAICRFVAVTVILLVKLSNWFAPFFVSIFFPFLYWWTEGIMSVGCLFVNECTRLSVHLDKFVSMVS